MTIMKIDRIEIEEVFPTASFANLKLKAAGSLEEGEDIVEAYKGARKKLQDAFLAMNPELNQQQETNYSAWRADLHSPPKPSVIDRAWEREKETMEKIIDDCQFPSDLIKHEDKAKIYGLTDMYADKLDELQKTKP